LKGMGAMAAETKKTGEQRETSSLVTSVQEMKERKTNFLS